MIIYKMDVVMKMDFKKNSGIILTLDKTNEFKGIVHVIVYYIQEYWTIFITFIGVYLLSTPKKNKKK